VIYQVLNDRKGTHSPEKASCQDCAHMKAAVSWWCTNKAAQAEGRTIPGYTNCPHWEPCETLTEYHARMARRKWWQRAWHVDPQGEAMIVDPVGGER